MKFFKLSVYLSVTVLLMAVSCGPQKVNVEAKKAEVEEYLNKILDAYLKSDLEALDALHSDDPDMALIGPDRDSWIVGWKAMREHMKPLFEDESFKYLEIKMSDLVIHISTYGDVAWFAATTDEEMEFQGEKVKLSGGRWTGTVEKRKGNWALVQQHYSLPTPGKIDQEEMRKIVEEETKKHIEYVLSGDPAAVASQYTEDAIRYLPMAGIMRGRKGVEKFWSAILPAEIDLSLNTVDLFGNDNIIYEIGNYSVEVKAEGQTQIKDSGDYFVVWERQADRSWKVRVDIALCKPPAK